MKKAGPYCIRQFRKLWTSLIEEQYQNKYTICPFSLYSTFLGDYQLCFDNVQYIRICLPFLLHTHFLHLHKRTPLFSIEHSNIRLAPAGSMDAAEPELFNLTWFTNHKTLPTISCSSSICLPITKHCLQYLVHLPLVYQSQNIAYNILIIFHWFTNHKTLPTIS